MFFVYIIQSKEYNKLYIGSTNNLERRLKEHNERRNTWVYKYRPWRYVYIEGFTSEKDARQREKGLKHFGKAYGQLKRRIQNSLHGI